MSRSLKPWWTAAKWLVIAAVLMFSGRALVQALSGVSSDEIWASPGWLAASGILYLAGVGFSHWFWWILLRGFGQNPGWFAALRAYYLGHLGKYVPGKALVVVMRTMLVRGPEVKAGVAALAVVYETLIFIATGALLAALLFLVLWERETEERMGIVLLLVFLAGIPVLPWVFNPILRYIHARLTGPGGEAPPAIGTRTVVLGLVLSAASWLVLGLSLWSVIQAVAPLPLGPTEWLRCTAFLAIAVAMGFVIPAPGGLGVREYVLLELLTPSLGAGPAALAAVLLRLAWVASEGIAAVVLYPLGCLPAGQREKAMKQQPEGEIIEAAADDSFRRGPS